MRGAQQVITLNDPNAYTEFQATLSGMGCPEEGIREAWEALKKNQSGEYHVTSRTLTDPAFAHSVKAVMTMVNAEPAPARQFAPLSPGEFAVEFEHRRLDPSKVNVWFRRGQELIP